MNDPIAELIEADKNRTPGSVVVHKALGYYLPMAASDDRIAMANCTKEPDASFIAAAANAMPAIVAMVDDRNHWKSCAETWAVNAAEGLLKADQEIERLQSELAECRKELTLAIDVGTLYLGWLGVTKTGAMRQAMRNPEVVAAVLAQQKGKEEST